MTEQITGRTESVCPVCLERIPAVKVQRGDKIYLEKTCPRHGAFSACIWGGQIPYDQWNRPPHDSAVNADRYPAEGCPYDCGICTEHRQKTCCVLLEVTSRCNLVCPICFASAGCEGQDLPVEEIERRYDYMMEHGGPFNIQLSGGEPTVRDDLPEIIRLGRKKGFTFFQLNTNGIRLAREDGYAGMLAEAGLSCVFLQFDGLDDTIYRRLRGADLLDVKIEAIRRCGQAGLGVVLVPTLVPGVNTDSIGEILRFAGEQLPVVRGVHFQPVSYFGRYEKRMPDERFTLSDLLQEIEEQTGGLMKKEDFSPGNAENPYCSMSGNFFLDEDGNPVALKQEEGGCGCQTGERSDLARAFVARQWSGVESREEARGCCCQEPESEETEDCCGEGMEQAALRIRERTLAVSAMVFMDAWNLDLERLKQCYIHVADGGGLIPFCAYNLSSVDGETLYRVEGR